MHRGAVALLVLVTLVTVGFTALGASPGHNKHRLFLEVLIFAAAFAGILWTTGEPRARAIGATVGLPALLLLAVLLLPALREARLGLVAPILPSSERGFVIAAFGMPDMVNGGIGIATVYGYRSEAQLLVIRFARSEHIDDPVADAQWMEEGDAVSRYSLHPPLLQVP